MTTKSDIEKAVEELNEEAHDVPPLTNVLRGDAELPPGEGHDAIIAYRTSEGWVDDDGNPLPEDATVAVRYDGVTVDRATAEEEGYEILGPADVDSDDADEFVLVPCYYDDKEGPS